MRISLFIVVCLFATVALGYEPLPEAVMTNQVRLEPYACNYTLFNRCGFNAWPDTDWPGNDFYLTGLRDIESVQDCRQICIDLPGCVAYVYRHSNRICWPKYAVSYPRILAGVIGENFHEKMAPPECHPVEGVSFAGRVSHTFTEVDGPAFCCDACFQLPECKGWRWERSSLLCHLITSIGSGGERNPRFVSGRNRFALPQ